MRLPAGEIEELVIGEIVALLRSPQRLLVLLDGQSLGIESEQLIAAVAKTSIRPVEVLAACVRQIIIRVEDSISGSTDPHSLNCC
jgi:hypothetical protein